MIWKAISKILTIAVLGMIVGLVALGGYFGYKSNQPMQVEETQRIAAGITFQEFWASRMDQWGKWDAELIGAGKNGACASTAQTMLPIRIALAAKYVADLRANQGNLERTRQLVADNNGVVPPDDLLYKQNFLDAWWSMIEYSTWFQYANDPGGFPVKELGQRHACATSYPTPTEDKPR